MSRARPNQWRLYVLVFGITSLVPTAGALLVNFALDPLWYGNGNQLFAENFPLNERFSKANLFLRAPEQIDCVVLGSSRSTLLDARRIKRGTCFNFSASNGHVDEFEYTLSFVEGWTKIDTVIVGLDAFNFSDHGLAVNVPNFVLANEMPPPALEAYLSIEILEFSMRSILSRKHRTRYYDSQFSGNVMPTAGPFVPTSTIDPADHYGGLTPSPTNSTGPFFPERTRVLETLREHHARTGLWIGYVPPLASQFIAQVDAAGNLDSYLEATWLASRNFDLFFDFSVPSEITTEASNTYDGSHFSRAANDLIAETLSGDGDNRYSLPVHDLSLPAYISAFHDRLSKFESDLEEGS